MAEPASFLLTSSKSLVGVGRGADTPAGWGLALPARPQRRPSVGVGRVGPRAPGAVLHCSHAWASVSLLPTPPLGAAPVSASWRGSQMGRALWDLLALQGHF